MKVDGFCFPQPLQGSRKPPATISDDLFAVGALLRELFPGQGLARELETVMFEALATNSRYRQAWAIADDLLAGEGIPPGSRQKLGEFIRGIEAPR